MSVHWIFTYGHTFFHSNMLDLNFTNLLSLTVFSLPSLPSSPNLYFSRDLLYVRPFRKLCSLNTSDRSGIRNFHDEES